MVGVDVYVWPVAKIERRDGDGGRVVVIVIAAARVGCYIRDQFIARALSAGAGFDNARVSRQSRPPHTRWQRRESHREIRRPRRSQNSAATTGVPVTWNTDLFLKGSPPTISMWMLARSRCRISGWLARNAMVPSTSGPQTKRRVRLGRGKLAGID